MNHRPVARVPEFRIDIVANEIEKGRELGKSTPFSLGFPAFGELVHEIQNVINRQISEFIITEFETESIHNERMGSNRIFFWN